MAFFRELRVAQRKSIALAEKSRRGDGKAAFAIVGIGILAVVGYTAWKNRSVPSSQSTHTQSTTTTTSG